MGCTNSSLAGVGGVAGVEYCGGRPGSCEKLALVQDPLVELLARLGANAVAGAGENRVGGASCAPGGVAYDDAPHIRIGEDVMKPWESVQSNADDLDTNAATDPRSLSRQHSDNGPLIVFMFGGPHSGKGRLIDDLVEAFDFRLVSGEELIFSELPRKLANIIKLATPSDIRKLIEDDPSYITADWMCQLLERRVSSLTLTSGSQTGSARFLVDMVPNMRYLLKTQGFTGKVDKPLERFEVRYPIAFALNLSLSKEGANASARSAASNDLQMTSAASAAAALMDVSTQTSDEADSRRQLKREILYNESVSCYLNYFGASRCLEIQVNAELPMDAVSRDVIAIFQGRLSINRKHAVNGVTLFAFDNESAYLDTKKYNLEVLEASELLMLNPDISTEKVLSELKNRLKDKTNNAIILKLDESLIDSYKEYNGGNKNKENHLLFIENTKDTNRNSTYQEFSAGNNHRYLFSGKLSPQLCRRLVNELLT